MLQFEGDREFLQGPEELWGKLADPAFLVGCVPDVQAVTNSRSDGAVFTLRPGVSFVRGTLEITLRLLEAVRTSSIRYSARSRGIGSTSEVEATLSLTPRESGTAVHWVAEVKQLGGLLKAVPHGLINASAQKVIGDVWAAVAAKLGA